MRRHTKPAQESEVDLTPMLDIVFILLIFFIVTATFIKENAINLTPPPPNQDKPVESKPTILIRIGEDSLLTVNGRLTDIGSVRAGIERLIAETPESAVLVQAHPRAKNELVILTVDRARSALGGEGSVGFTVDG